MKSRILVEYSLLSLVFTATVAVVLAGFLVRHMASCAPGSSDPTRITLSIHSQEAPVRLVERRTGVLPQRFRDSAPPPHRL